MRRNCKYNEENLFPLCKYMGTIYSSLLSYRGIFSASGKEGKKPRVQMLGAVRACVAGTSQEMVNFSHTEPGCLRRPLKTCFLLAC